MSLTLSQIAQNALDVQDACNPLAVARLYVRMTDDLLAHHGVRGTAAICTHPAVVLVAHKLADLSNVSSIGGDSYAEAFVECMAMASLADELDAVSRRIHSDGFADGGCEYTDEEINAA